MKSKSELIKYDDGKVPLTLLPPEALEAVAKVLQFGARKYAAHNWRKGSAWTRQVDATMRHLNKWLMGTDIDAESGCNHLAHAICDLMFVLTFQLTATGTDDRYVSEQRKPVRQPKRSALSAPRLKARQQGKQKKATGTKAGNAPQSTPSEPAPVPDSTGYSLPVGHVSPLSVTYLT